MHLCLVSLVVKLVVEAGGYLLHHVIKLVVDGVAAHKVTNDSEEGRTNNDDHEGKKAGS